MDALDGLILVAAGFAIFGGYRLGFLARAVSWVGMALGLVVAARVLPSVINRLQSSDATGRLLVAALVLMGGAFLGQAAGLLLGTRLHAAIPPGPLRTVDRVIGAGVGVLGFLFALWVLLPSMADVRGWPAREARNSRIARLVDGSLPAPPDTVAALRRLIGSDAFPQVFNALRPSPDVGPPPANSGLSAATLRAVAASTVKVQGEACRREQEGSGFAVGPDVILTNAHVVAGEHHTAVLQPSGRLLDATVVLFDSNRDLALLRVPGLNDAPLTVSAQPSSAAVGATGAVFGHPGGQDALRVSPATVRQNVQALGRDLYETHDTRRDVFFLASSLMPGDSGGALVDSSGTVVGVAFAIAPDQPGTSYALTAKEIRAVLPGASATAPVATGACIAG